MTKKKVSSMKTSEILNELANDLSDEMFTELEEELVTRHPFSFIDSKLIEIGDKLDRFEKTFDRHRHIGSDIVIKV